MFYIKNIKNIWLKHGFITIVILSIIILCIFYLFNINGTGTYDVENIFFDDVFSSNKKKLPTLSKGEQICRNFLENYFQKPFPNVRPNFMFNPETGSNLELDMFNSDLRLACEYNGKQHYQFNSYIHRNYNNFIKQTHRDEIKRNICKKLGIHLIEVPYTISHKNIPDFLNKKLKSIGY